MIDILIYILKLVGATFLFAIFSTIIGCLLSGLDRIISAKMQGRIGPPLLQPFYDLCKLFTKERAAINSSEQIYIIFALIFVFIAGGIFYSGGNLMMCIFIITLSSMLLIMAAYCSRSPFSDAGAAREILQVMSYEPAILLFAIIFMIALDTTTSNNLSESAYVASVLNIDMPLISKTAFAWIGLLYVLTIKLRKSPFDIASAQHAHQDIVSGITTEMTGTTLALFEIMHMSETVLFLGWIGIFFIYSNPISIFLAIIIALLVWFLEIVIDNNSARVKWQFMLKSSWIIALLLGAINLILLIFI